MKKTTFTLLLALGCMALGAWTADLGNGSYRNPVLYADYSDPDVVRVNKDYYMTASSFNCIPALPVLHSNDLVNWELVNYALPKLEPAAFFNKAQHGNGVWAPSIRHHKGEYYIYWGDPDFGIFMIKTKNPRGEWSTPVLVKEGKGLIDPCPLWDNDGKAYLSYAFAGSRAGHKSVLAMTELSVDGTKTLGEARIVFCGHEKHPTVEGTKLYKRNGFYYLFAPAGGVKTGWQLVLRSKNIWGPYDEKIVLSQGETSVNGPHQGAWTDTPKGEDWFIHFQDVGAGGRIAHLQPMVWKNDFPVIGEDPDGDGTGQPVMTHQKPNVGKTYPVWSLETSDEFDNLTLGLQWQWHANPQTTWSFCDKANSRLRLYSVYTDSVKNLWNVPNLLLQKFPAPKFTATAKISFTPDARYTGERFSFVVMGENYATLSIENTANGLVLRQLECKKAHQGTGETANESVNLSNNEVYLRIQAGEDGKCLFYYSFDNKMFISVGGEFQATAGRWIGSKIGFTVQRSRPSNDGGYADVDWIKITEK